MKKTNKTKIFLIFFVILNFTLLNQGCGIISPFQIVTPIINSFVYWQNGEGHIVYNFNQDIVYRSTKRAIEKMGFSIDYEKNYGKQDQNYYIVFVQENKIKVTIQKKDNNVSKVSIRLNTFGDREFGEMLFKNIESDLNTIVYDEQGNVN